LLTTTPGVRGVDPAPITGSQNKSDVYTTTTLGANLNVPWSRQRFLLGWAWTRVRLTCLLDPIVG